MTILFAVFILVIVSFVLWGVGSAVVRWSNSRPVSWPLSIAIGLAATIFIGGLLNVAHIAYAPALWALGAMELAVAMLEISHAHLKFQYDPGAGLELASAALVIALVILFAISTQLPPKTFNSHDDFQKYFAHPVRMLETGTLSGSPLSSLGSETLGGQAFLHGVVLSAFPIAYINGVDAIFGLLALMLLAASAGWRRFAPFPGAVLGPLLVAMINPQYTNISPIYLGGFLMAAAVMLVADAPQEAESPLPSSLPLALIYAALVALKPTFAIFVLFHFAISVITASLISESRRRALASAARVIAFAAVGLAPWLLLHLHLYFYSGRGLLPSQPTLKGNDGTLNLFSTRTLFYGASFIDYTAVVILAAVVALTALLSSRSTSDPGARRRSLAIFAGATSGVLGYVVLVVFLGKILNGYEGCLRYSVPYILGACAISIVLAAILPSSGKTISKLFPVLATLVVCVLFLPSLVTRYSQAVRFGSVLAFGPLVQSPQYAAYNQFCLSPPAKQYILALQDKVPPGAPLVAWINTPYLLDYRRNEILDADTVGLSTRWAHVPEGVRYVLWQYAGEEVPTSGDYAIKASGPGEMERGIAARDLAFANHLSDSAQSAQVIATDGQFVLFRVPGHI